jgi:hypothetical protein
MPETVSNKEGKGIGEDVKFVSDSMEEVADALSRYAIIPTPTDLLDTEGLMAATDEEIAQSLSKIEVVDPHFDRLDFDKDQGWVESAILSAAKAKGTANQIEDTGVKKRFEEFADRVLAGVGKTLATKGALAGSTSGILAIVMTACGATGEAVGAGSAEVPSDGGGIRTQEVVEILVEPTDIPTSTPEITATPEVEERGVGIVPNYQFFSVENPDEIFEPLDESAITRLIFEETGEPLPYGLIEQWTSGSERSTQIFISGIFRGFQLAQYEIGSVGYIILEVPLESGDSQYLVLTSPHADYTDLDRVYLIPETGAIPPDNQFAGFQFFRREPMPFTEVNKLLSREELVGRQLIIGLTSYFKPEGMSAEDEQKNNEVMEKFIEGMQEGNLINNIEGGRFSIQAITLPESILQ